MKLENPRKVKNIVSRNFEKFQEMYKGILKLNEKINFLDGKFHQDKNVLIQEEMYTKLPRNLKSLLKPPISYGSCEEFRDNLRKAIAKIVYSSSITQTLKGVLTAGFFKSARYAKEKFKKAKH